MGAYVALVERVLVAGQGLFPQGGPAVGVLNAHGFGVPSAAGTSALAAGADGANGHSGRAGTAGVRQSAQASAAAIAPLTNSPAGVKLLVSTMDDRMAAMQRQIETTRAQNTLLAARMRQIAIAL